MTHSNLNWASLPFLPGGAGEARARIGDQVVRYSSRMGKAMDVMGELMRLKLVRTSRWVSEVSSDSARPSPRREGRLLSLHA